MQQIINLAGGRSILCSFHVHAAGATRTMNACAADALQRPPEAVLQKFLSTFRAADETKQGMCEAILNGTQSVSQTRQDLAIWQNLFSRWAIDGKQGFYVDSGANHPVKLSNTWFFDKCLGWKGLCIEPNTRYHSALRAERTCTLVPECISANTEMLPFAMSGVVGHVTSGGGRTVQCNPLRAMLSRVNQKRCVRSWALHLHTPHT